MAVDPYASSKYQSEVIIDEFVAALPAEARFSHVYINPGAIYGPLLNATHISGSPQLVRDLMTGTFPLVPAFSFGTVDVREVARAHISAMVHQELTGRFILVKDTYSLANISAIGKRAYPTVVSLNCFLFIAH